MSAAAPVIDETDVVSFLEQMLAGDVPCDRPGCATPATWHVTCFSHCGNEALLCSAHYKQIRDMNPGGTRLRCPRCHRTGLFPLLFKSRML